MCLRCISRETDFDIKDTDLPFLPYKEYLWKCYVPGCTCRGTTVRDYGLYPLVYIPRKNPLNYTWQRNKRIYDPDKPYKQWERVKIGTNWFNIQNHFNVCGKHWQDFKKGVIPTPETITDDFITNTFIIKPQKVKPNGTTKKRPWWQE